MNDDGLTVTLVLSGLGAAGLLWSFRHRIGTALRNNFFETRDLDDPEHVPVDELYGFHRD